MNVFILFSMSRSDAHTHDRDIENKINTFINFYSYIFDPSNQAHFRKRTPKLLKNIILDPETIYKLW